MAVGGFAINQVVSMSIVSPGHRTTPLALFQIVAASDGSVLSHTGAGAWTGRGLTRLERASLAFSRLALCRLSYAASPARTLG